MASKKDMLKQGATKTGKGLFQGMQRLEDIQAEEIKTSKEEKQRKTASQAAEQTAGIPAPQEKILQTVDTSSSVETSEDKAVETKAPRAEGPNRVTEAADQVVTATEQVGTEQIAAEQASPVQTAPVQTAPVQAEPVQSTTVQSVPIQTAAQPETIQSSGAQTANTAPVGVINQGEVPAAQNTSAQTAPVQNTSDIQAVQNQALQPEITSAIDESSNINSGINKASKPSKTVDNTVNKSNSRYEKDKFLLLDIRGYRDYVEHMAKAANMSATKYIRNLIDQDMEKNRDIYEAHKALEEKLRQRSGN